jgi:hypothetical protein
MIDILKLNPTKHNRSSKLSEGQPVDLKSHGHSSAKRSKQLGVSERPVCNRVKKVSVKAKCKRGGVSKYEKVGSKDFRCSVCKSVKSLSKRRGTKCHKCIHEQWISTTEGALRYRFSMKKSVARRKGILFTITLDEFKGQYEKQAGKDGYTGEQFCFAFGQGRSRVTGSVDRIVNEGGYTPGNFVFCRLATNSKKGNRPVERLIEQLEFEFSTEGGGDSQPETEEVANLEKAI